MPGFWSLDFLGEVTNLSSSIFYLGNFFKVFNSNFTLLLSIAYFYGQRKEFLSAHIKDEKLVTSHQHNQKYNR